MSIEPDALRYVGLYEEPDGSYQIDHSGTPADFLAYPYEEGTLQVQGMVQDLRPTPGKIRRDGDVKGVLGPKTCTAAMATTLHSHGVDCDGASDVPTKSTWALARMLTAIMGGALYDDGTSETSSSQTTVQSATVTAVTVDSGHGARFANRGVIGCQVVSGSTNLELREIESIASDVITVKEAFSAAPIASTPVRGGATFYMTENPLTALQLLVEGREATDGVSLRGLQGGFSLTLPVGGLGQLSVALAGAGWDRMGASSATSPTYGVYSPIALNPLKVTIPTVGTTTHSLIAQAEVTIEPQITYRPQRSGAADETIARMVRAETRPLVQGSFVVPYEDDTWYAHRDAKTTLALFAQLGTIAGSCALVSVPTIEIVDVQPSVSGEGIAGQTVTWRARHDEETGAGSTEIGYSALRLHFC